MKVNIKESSKKIFFKNFVGGLGWMLGATVGFALIISLVSLLLKWLGGLPVIGNSIANLIESVNKALEVKQSLPK